MTKLPDFGIQYSTRSAPPDKDQEGTARMNITLSNGQWRTIIGVATAVLTYLVASDLHPDVVLPPVVSVVLGAILVGLAVVKVPEGDTTVPPAS